MLILSIKIIGIVVTIIFVSVTFLIFIFRNEDKEIQDILSGDNNKKLWQ